MYRIHSCYYNQLYDMVFHMLMVKRFEVHIDMDQIGEYTHHLQVVVKLDQYMAHSLSMGQVVVKSVKE